MIANKSTKLGAYIGRLRPCHNAHYFTIKQALKENDYVLILIGSCGKPRDIKNPFVFSEIKIMIESLFEQSDLERLKIVPMLDHSYSDTKWVSQVQKNVQNTMNEYSITDNSNVFLYGNEKDNTSTYLKWFPQWKFKACENITNLNATDIRKAFFETENPDGNNLLIKSKVPNNVYQFLMAFKETKEYAELKKEYDFIKSYKEAWSKAPYAPTFVTVDSIVECSGHILLIKRKATPGSGLWALPGGFIDIDETIEESMLRELKEETKIDVSKNILKGNIVKQHVFDNPGRSLRGRTITHGFHIVLPQMTLPNVKGSDDADEAKWFPIADVATMENIIFEDHLDIISYFTGLTKEFQY